ncbi:diguanylate cyclase domain-containing protein [Bradyrhizobium elkanii]|uniref:diguanylate cyclase domain-containing protein n=1 Tax=Bradyrhizobium elkanii TaxID=29448 RepID=UPI0030B99F0A
MTGLPNRRHFDDRLAEERARAKRDGTPLSLLLIDVDHFKKFNDQYGHQSSEACLRLLAGILAAQVRRPADLAARYDREESRSCCRTPAPTAVLEVGEKVRAALASSACCMRCPPPSSSRSALGVRRTFLPKAWLTAILF